MSEKYVIKYLHWEQFVYVSVGMAFEKSSWSIFPRLGEKKEQSRKLMNA